MKCFLKLLICAVSISLVFGEIIDKDFLKNYALKELKNKFGNKVKIVDLSLLPINSLHYEKIERVVVNVRENNPRGNVHIYVRTRKGVRRITVSLRLLWRCKITVTLTRIEKGERISLDLLEIKEKFLPRCPTFQEDPEEFINYIALKDIPAGSLLRRQLIRKEALVKRGEEVTAVLKKGNLEIRFTAKSLDRGFYRDIVRIKIPSKGKVLKGRVIAEGFVIVN